jgi:hypothetical protein
MMNGEESGWCYTDESCFKIPVDEKGNNIVTGQGYRFTCIDLEVFSVVYDIHPYQDPNFERYLQKQNTVIQRNEFRKTLE